MAVPVKHKHGSSGASFKKVNMSTDERKSGTQAAGVDVTIREILTMRR